MRQSIIFSQSAIHPASESVSQSVNRFKERVCESAGGCHSTSREHVTHHSTTVSIAL